MEGYVELSRRRFIRVAMSGGLAACLSPSLLLARTQETRITILHTNDTHSRIDPFPSNDPKHAGMGGVARRSEMIKTIRSSSDHVLLLDSGDFFQGTPYFNLFGGAVEIAAMNSMKYDASTLGNHEFDNGVDSLAKQLSMARFPIINSNYKVTGTPLESLVHPYRIFERGDIHIGVFGLGIELSGLVDPTLCAGIEYSEPVETANRMVRFLRKEAGCQVVICLSHLGHSYKNHKISDRILAELVPGIDLILGGHTHTFLDKPDCIRNRSGEYTLVAQAGWAGLHLGRIDFIINRKEKRFTCESLQVKKTG